MYATDLESQVARSVDSAVREVFHKAAERDEMLLVMKEWLDSQGIRLGQGRGSGQWALMHNSVGKAGIVIGNYPSFTRAFEAALEIINQETT